MRKKKQQLWKWVIEKAWALKKADEFYHHALQQCLDVGDAAGAKLLHSHMIQTQFHTCDVSLANKLLTVYAKFDSLENARRYFDAVAVAHRDVISWTTIMCVYAAEGRALETLRFLPQMLRSGIRPNHFTFSAILPCCATLECVELGKQIHGRVIRAGFAQDLYVANALIDVYGKCGSMKDARQVFDEWSRIGIGRDVVSWNALLCGYALNEFVHEAWQIFCSIPGNCRNQLSWSLMISAFAQNGYAQQALTLYHQMQMYWHSAQGQHQQKQQPIPNTNTFASALSASAQLQDACAGMLIHRQVIVNGVAWDISVQNALVSMYSSCNRLKSALFIFDRMLQRNVISWTSMIAGFVQNEQYEQSLNLFRHMQRRGIEGNYRTIVAVLAAVAEMCDLGIGMQIHSSVMARGFGFCDPCVDNALIHMYAKCGSIQAARSLFDNMMVRDVVSWSTIISAYALHGHPYQAFKLFEMMKSSGVYPNHVTFLAVLTACCHAGLVHEGKSYFHDMVAHFKITPTMEHYGCMVHLLSRAGHLTEAEMFITRMPVAPDLTLWLTLLGACGFHKNVQLAERVSYIVSELGAKSSAPCTEAEAVS